MERRSDEANGYEDDLWKPSSCQCVLCGGTVRIQWDIKNYGFHWAYGHRFTEAAVVIKAEGARGIYVLLREPNDASDTWGVLVYRLGPPFEYVYHKRFDSEETARSDFGLQCVRYAAVPLDTGENHGTIGPAGGRAL